MSEIAMRMKIDLHKQAARAFVAAKGRMPSDKYELQAWLMEFTEQLGNLLERWQEIASDSAMAILPKITLERR